MPQFTHLLLRIHQKPPSMRLKQQSEEKMKEKDEPSAFKVYQNMTYIPFMQRFSPQKALASLVTVCECIENITF